MRYDYIRDDGRTVTQDTRDVSMTLGEDRVRVKFNPSDNSLVGELKQKTAALIDLCAKLRAEVADSDRPQHELGEIFRCISLAQTHFEDAAMWAVKAATAP